MRKMTKKNVVLALVSLLAIGGSTAGYAITANASTNGAFNDLNIQLTNIGAAVRTAKDSDGGYGLRFAAEIDKNVYEALERLEETDGVSVDYGMLITPRDMMTDDSNNFYDLTEANVFAQGAYYTIAETEDITSGPAVVNIVSNSLSETNADGDFRIIGSLTSIRESNLTREFVAKPYVKYSDGTKAEYVFGDEYTKENVGQAARSLAYVGVEAKVNKDNTEWIQQNVLDEVVNYQYFVTHHYVDANGTEIEAKKVTETQTGKLGEIVCADIKADTPNHEYAAANVNTKAEATLYPNGKTKLDVYYEPISLTPVEVFDSATAAANVKSNQKHTSTFIDQVAVEAAEGALPAIPSGSTGYVQIQNNEMNGEFKVHYVMFGLTTPDCTVDDFKKADYVEIQLYLDSDVANFSAMRRYDSFINKWDSTHEKLSPKSWVTIRYNLEWFNLGDASVNNLDALYSYFTDGVFFQMNTGETTATGAIRNLYISYIKLVREAADESLGDKFIDVSEANALQLDQSEHTMAWDEEKGALKVTKGTTYLALKFNPNAKMKNFSELSSYSKIRFVMTLPRWGKANGTTPQVYGLKIDNVELTNTNPTCYSETLISEGQDAGYYYVEMDMETFMKFYTYFSQGKRCMLCQGNNVEPVEDWYIKDIVCVR